MTVLTEALKETPSEQSPIEAALQKYQEGTPRHNAISLLGNTEALHDFVEQGGTIAVSLYDGELTYADPTETVLGPQTEEQYAHEKDTIVLDYTEFIADRRTCAEEQAKRDFGDPDNGELKITPEKRGEIAQQIHDAVNHYMHNKFDEEFTSAIALTSRHRPVDIQMNPTDTVKAMEQQHAWLTRLRDYVSYTRREHTIRFVLKLSKDTLQGKMDYHS
jgi:hypothetical protein